MMNSEPESTGVVQPDEPDVTEEEEGSGGGPGRVDGKNILS
jgi:hypothetical protein